MADMQESSKEDSNVGEEKQKKWPGYCKTFLVKDSHGAIKELVFPKALDLDRPKRERTTFSNKQLNILEKEFSQNQYLVGKDRTLLAIRLGLSETQVKVWFQNRRTKHKKDKVQSGESKNERSESKAAQNVLKLLEYRTAVSYNNAFSNLPFGYDGLRAPRCFQITHNRPKQGALTNKNVEYHSTDPVPTVSERHQAINRPVINDFTSMELQRNSTFDLSQSAHSAFREVEASSQSKSLQTKLPLNKELCLKPAGSQENAQTPVMTGFTNTGQHSSTYGLKSPIHQEASYNSFIDELKETHSSSQSSTFQYIAPSLTQAPSERLNDIYYGTHTSIKMPAMKAKKVDLLQSVAGSYSQNYPILYDLDNFKSKPILKNGSGIIAAPLLSHPQTFTASNIYYHTESLRNNVPSTSQEVFRCQTPSRSTMEFSYQNSLPYIYNNYGKVKAPPMDDIPH